MLRLIYCFIITALFLGGCSQPDAEKQSTASALSFKDMPLPEVIAYVKQHYPSTEYATNDLLPAPGTTPTFEKLDEKIKIKVGMPWVLNDEEAIWYIAAEKGFFDDVGLEVELVAGGPGRDHLATLQAGSVDIGVSASSAPLLRLLNSRTSGDLVMVGGFLKQNPYSWIMLDKSIPNNERSTLKITPELLKGKRVGIQAGYEFIWPVLAQTWGMDESDVTIQKVGFTPATLMQGTVDFYAAWIVNQPRVLEENGFYNWVALEFRKEGIVSQNDVSCVRRETLEKHPDMIRRYLAALTLATQFLLDNPQESAVITQKWAKDAQLSIPQILRRFELQRPLVVGDGSSPILHINIEDLNRETAVLLKYSQIESLKGTAQ